MLKRGTFMKRMRIVTCLLIGTVVFLIFGCGKNEMNDIADDKTDIAATEVVSTDKVEQDAEAEDEDGQIRSYLTGRVTDPSIARKRPVAIMLNNLKAAQPMCGISRAEVVYESVVEGSITRLMGIFEDYADLEKIGSVRSCREYYVYFALEFDAIYAHYGQAAYAVELLEKEYVDNLSGLSAIGSTVFYRTSDRKSPHNVYASAEGIKAGIEKLGYDTEYRSTYEGKFKFAKDGELTTNKDGDNATYVAPGYLINKPWFEYNSEDMKYYRFQFEEPQIDELTGEQISYDNIVLQYCKCIQLDENDYLAFDCHSGGKIKYITGGKVVDGFWIRTVEGDDPDNHDEGVAKYYDNEGNEIVMNQGKTWICIIQDFAEDKVEIK